MNEPTLVFSLSIVAVILTLVSIEYFISREKNVLYILKLIVYGLGILLIIFLSTSQVIDNISVVFGITCIAASLPVSLYSIDYLERKGYTFRVSALIDFFALAMFFTFISPNIISLAISWTAAEFLGFALIAAGEEHSRSMGVSASKRFLAVSTSTFELTLFTLIYVSIFSLAGSFIGGGLDVLTRGFGEFGAYTISLPLYIAPLLIIGFIAKSAQVPLHFWLPDAHSIAPAPASSLLSGVMTGMGIYGLYRVFQIVGFEEPMKSAIALIICVCGIISIIYGGLQAYTQQDIKRMLAYSTIAGNGLTVSILGLYIVYPDPMAYTALAVSFISHALYKAALFLNAGSIESIFGTRDIESLRGLGSISPPLFISSIISVFSLIGMPPTIGFAAKLLAILASFSKGVSVFSAMVVTAVVLSIIVSVLVGFRYVMMYYGKPSPIASTARISNVKMLLLPEIFLSSLNIASVAMLVFTPVEKGLINAILLASIIPVITLIYIAIIIAMRAGRVR